MIIFRDKQTLHHNIYIVVITTCTCRCGHTRRVPERTREQVPRGTREGSSAERSLPGFGLMVAVGDVKVKVIIEVLSKVNVGVR